MTVNWTSLQTDAQRILTFLTSIDKRRFGTGRALYDPVGFMIKPRSDYFNSLTYQWVVNIGNPNAKFEAVQGGFLELKKKIEALAAQIGPIRSTPEAKKFLMTLIEMDKMIESTSRSGLKRLCKNYQVSDKKLKADSLMGVGTECFSLLTAARARLESQMVAADPKLIHDITLARYAFSPKDLLQNRDEYRTSLRYVVHCPGVQIPYSLVADAMSDAKHLFKHSRVEVATAAREIGLPKMAQPISAHNGKAAWTPLRLTGEQGNVSIEPGVTGTCEMSQDLVNFYYLVHPLSKRLTISCGALNTPRKIDQFMLGWSKAVSEVPPEDSRRWVVLQLNSFSSEPNLVREMQLNIPTLKTRMGQCELLHFNLSFKPEAEDPAQRTMVNLDSLALLTILCLKDVKELFNDPRIDSPLTKRRNEVEQNFSENITQLESCVATRRAKIPLEPEKVRAGTFSFYQDDMTRCLVESVFPSIKFLQEKVRAQKNPNFRSEKALLLLTVLLEILSWQFNLESKSATTRCQELELMLFAFRLLDIDVVLVSKDGLDRAGAARAIVDAQSQLEKHLYQEELEKINAEDEEEDALLKAQFTLFDLIQHFEHYRDILFKAGEELMKVNKFHAVSDLKVKTEPQEENLRETIMEAIDRGDEEDSEPIGDKLKLALLRS